MTDMIVIPGIADDGSLFPIEKLRAHSEAVFHVAVSVFVFDDDGALLIQKRSVSKYHSGGLWANTCCSHPHWQETVADCAPRRLHEELGFSVPLEARGIVEYAADVSNGLHEHEQVALFVGRAARDDVMLAPDPDEVADTRWISISDLHDEIAATPQKFTPWLRIYLNRFPELDFSVAR